MKHNLEQVNFYYDFIDLIDKKIQLTPHQKEILRSTHNFHPYYIFKQKPIVKTTFLWRLTIPFYVIYCILFGFIINPIKWILTGKKYESHQSISYKIYNYWSDKIKIYL